MPRFVLLYHETPAGFARPSHWDLMFEAGDRLRTWALGQLPADWEAIRGRTLAVCRTCPEASGGQAVAAQELGDHRRDYLTYEGPVSGNRGRVFRVEEGTFRAASQSADVWEVAVEGGDLRGRVTLRRVGPGGAWQLSVGASG